MLIRGHASGPSDGTAERRERLSIFRIAGYPRYAYTHSANEPPSTTPGTNIIAPRRPRQRPGLSAERGGRSRRSGPARVPRRSRGAGACWHTALALAPTRDRDTPHELPPRARRDRRGQPAPPPPVTAR